MMDTGQSSTGGIFCFDGGPFIDDAQRIKDGAFYGYMAGQHAS